MYGEFSFISIVAFLLAWYVATLLSFACVFLVYEIITLLFDHKVVTLDYKHDFLHLNIFGGIVGLQGVIIKLLDLNENLLIIPFVLTVVFSIIVYHCNKKSYKEKRKQYLYFSGQTNADIFNSVNETNIPLPKNFPDGLQSQKGKYGDYTVFLANYGSKIHYKKGCCSAFNEWFVFHVYGSDCKKCEKHKPTIPITREQYRKYIKLCKELKEYDIPFGENETKDI